MAQSQTTTGLPDGAGTGDAAANGTSGVSARILKKRETDRRCQRMIRERTKSRIAYLEGLVEQFRLQDSSGRVETLMKQLSDVKGDRDRLAKKVKNIESIITDSKLKEEPDLQDLSVSKLQPEHPEGNAISRLDTRITSFKSPQLDDGAYPSEQESLVYALHNKEYSAYLESSSRTSWATSTLHSATHQPCECSSPPDELDTLKPLNKWRYANDTLTEWFKWSPQALDMTKFATYNDDVPIRAIVEGWDAVEKHGHMHPAWRLLRGIDETLFRTCDRRERLAILYTMGLLLQAHLNPTTEYHKKLPAFYLKRPSQDMLHSYATEYFTWPGLRERFVFSEHRYCSNIFWRLFCSNLRVQWPFEFRDTYVKNTETGLYKVSPTFRDRLYDIRTWTMGMDMFKQYPELYGDIPTWNHIPASVAPSLNMTRAHSGGAMVPMASAPLTRPRGTELAVRERTQSAELSDNFMSPNSVGQQQQQQQLHHQDSYSPYPQVSPSGNFDSMNASLSPYDFPMIGVVTTGAEMQPSPTMNAWSYNGNLDVFPLNPP